MGERHYDVQLAGGLILHSGKIAEMKTGENTCINITSIFKCFKWKRCSHSYSERYLAKRDSEWMGKVFTYLGISTGCITNNLDDNLRKKL